MSESAVVQKNVAAVEEREHISCNLCGKDDTIFLYEMPDLFFNPTHIFSVVQCRHCELAYQNPRPTSEGMSYYYPKEFYENNLESDVAFITERYKRQRLYVNKYAPKITGHQPKLFDVGCANGGFPRFMKAQGWDVAGQDIGTPPLKKNDFPVHYMLLPDVPINTPEYDVVTSWAVMEHVHDPMAYFKKVSEILKPGGVFIFLVTNIDSISSHSLYREDVPRHTYFYNRNTIRRYMKETGLELVDSIDTNYLYDMRPVGWMSYALNKIKGRPKLKWNEYPPQLHEWLAKNGYTNNKKNIIRYILAHPLAAFERFTLPVFEAWQKATKSYGITVYVARKPQ